MHSNETINKTKRPPSEWKKIFANEATDSGLKTASSISGAGKTGQVHVNSLTSYTKINSKWNKNLNGRPDTINLLEEDLGRTLFDINHSKIFFEPPPRVMEIKTKINKWDLMKLKSFRTAKETITRRKDNPQNGRKYLQMKQLTKD